MQRYKAFTIDRIFGTQYIQKEAKPPQILLSTPSLK